MLYGQVDGAPLGQLVRWRRDGVATYNVLFRDVKVNPVELPKVYGVWLYCDRGSFSEGGREGNLPPPPPPPQKKKEGKRGERERGGERRIEKRGRSRGNKICCTCKCHAHLPPLAGERDVQKVLYTTQNVRWSERCAKSALYSTKCTLENKMCKKCSTHHKMYDGERDVQKVLYTTQNIRWRIKCA